MRPGQGGGSRIYDDPCGVARALNTVGDRWALLVVRELLFGAKRFTDLQRGLPTITPNVLSQRLHDLESAGVITRTRLGPPAGSAVYELTPRGRRLEAVLRALAEWGSRMPLESTAELSVDALVLALHTTVDKSRPSLVGTFLLELGADRVYVTVDGHSLSATRTPSPSVTAAITTDVATLRATVFAGADVESSVRSGALSIEGDADAAHRFLGFFVRPRPIADASEGG